ncbi:Fc.00g065890.m01.CDS01 [Cosmosporella sp. VM-42]
MRFSTVFVTGALAVLASAQSATEKSTATATVGLDPVQSSQLACYDACDDGDVECKSHCVAVPAPDDQQVNDTNACVADCPQGDGSEAETNKYSECVQGCIQKHFFATSGGTPQATGSSDDSSNSNASGSIVTKVTKTGSAADSTGTSDSDSDSDSKSDSDSDSTPTGTGSQTGTATGAASTATTTNAAPGLVVGSAGFVGLIAAIFAL